MGEITTRNIQPDGEKRFAECFRGDAWELPTDFGVVDPAAQEFERRLQEAGWDEDEIVDIIIGFREALVNAIGHGNLGMDDPEDIRAIARSHVPQAESEKKVHVAFSFEKDEPTRAAIGVRVLVRDEGSGFDWQRALAKETGEQTEGSLQGISGRGLLLMRHGFPDIGWNDSGNEVVLRRARKKDPEQ